MAVTMVTPQDRYMEWAPSDLSVVAWHNAIDLPVLSGLSGFGSVWPKVSLQRQKASKMTKKAKIIDFFEHYSCHALGVAERGPEAGFFLVGATCLRKKPG